MNLRLHNPIRLVIALLVSHSAGFIGSLVAFTSEPSWYDMMNKPSFAPPDWVFTPVWLTLYTMMGVSLYLICAKDCGKDEKRNALYIFAVQLVLNALWIVIFLGFNSAFFALIDITFLLFAIAITIFTFYRISKPASLLLVPYLIWVGFAMVLNYSIWVMNA